MGIFDILKPKDSAEPPGDRQDSVLFSTAFAGLGVDASLLVPWEARAVEIDAKRLNPGRGTKLLQTLWAKDRYMQHLEPQAIAHLEQHFDFASVPANRDLIRQDEYGNFMIVLLSGSVAVDRVQPWGERLRLAEIRPGEILGEMSLLDSGIRFSACTTTAESEIAVLTAEGIDEMMAKRPQLAACLIALLARKLSLRLRVVSARLSEKK
ncbi:MAG: cyclic nucleotide-binding domain-containing protein [Betaproteobacteria bacterium]